MEWLSNSAFSWLQAFMEMYSKKKRFLLCKGEHTRADGKNLGESLLACIPN